MALRPLSMRISVCLQNLKTIFSHIISKTACKLSPAWTYYITYSNKAFRSRSRGSLIDSDFTPTPGSLPRLRATPTLAPTPTPHPLISILNIPILIFSLKPHDVKLVHCLTAFQLDSGQGTQQQQQQQQQQNAVRNGGNHGDQHGVVTTRLSLFL